MKRISLIFLLSVVSLSLFAQHRKFGYAELGGSSVFTSLNFDMRFTKQSNDGLGFRVDAGSSFGAFDISLMETWENSQSSLQRRVFWYYQARLRWVGQTPPPNSEELLSKIETRIEKEVPEVQWAMNYTAAQIGIFEEKYRSRCIALGERTGLYKDEVVTKNCTPNYLPKLIAIQVDKLKK
jgi:hypothetical protein